MKSMAFEKSIRARIIEVLALQKKPRKTIRDMCRISRFSYLLRPNQ